MARKTEEDFPDIAWKPHLEVKADRFLGTFDQEWWVGSYEAPQTRVDDGFLVPLLPLLEHPLPEILSEFSLLKSAPDSIQPVTLATFALEGSQYWAVCALRWLEDGLEDFDRWDLIRQLTQNSTFSQEARHRAMRLLKSRGHSS
jgi:hypothetical protein